MIVLLHVLIAISSVAYSTYTFFAPAVTKMRINFVLVVATLASGTYLVAASHAGMLRACTTGLMYVVGVTTILWASQRKLTAVSVRSGK